MTFRGRQPRPPARGGSNLEREPASETVSYVFFPTGWNICPENTNVECELLGELTGKRGRGKKHGLPAFIAVNAVNYLLFGNEMTLNKGDMFSASIPGET